MIKEKLIGEALQQMTGFKVGIENDIIMLISNMGLTREEWEHIKLKEDSGFLFDSDIEEINKHFANCVLDETEEQDGNN